MQAKDLATGFPTVRLDTPAREAAQLLAEQQLPGLVVVDENGHPVAVLPGSQVLRRIIPGYVQDDPTLARVLDEASADKLCETLVHKTVSDLLPRERGVLPKVTPGDTVLEIAAVMAASRSPLVAVVDGPTKTASLVGVVTVSALLKRLLASDVKVTEE